MKPMILSGLAAFALTGCTANLPARSAAEPRVSLALTPATMIERLHRGGVRGVVAVTGYLRYESPHAELWQSAEAARSSNPLRSCVVLVSPRPTRALLRRYNGQMVTLRGYMGRHTGEEGARRIGSCNEVALRLLRRDL